ncbi:WD40 repeat-like protein [Aaosphaeria arxii CBS 175.79]|uniref:WD40 repeat-like protein n=1 Tax=Aaosphaeria arxii CBS 175.79 TaxID=1450172 RepID=A0A6A5Y271_9PLEO|nr:WD40 repeat-like protein [Aaosphaeria arxii CBS 175.79]KAF2019645.1 WD40 repeat-like protein [Aaosphaeria arxii CBS 175.79]
MVSSDSLEKKRRLDSVTKWSMSAPVGGWFLPHDTIFSADEKFLLVASPRALQIYSAETSIRVRELAGSSLATYALSSANPDHVYVASSTGLISLWDWTTGSKIGRWDIGAVIQQIAVVPQPDTDLDLVYCQEGLKRNIINVHALRTKSQDSKTELKQILKATSGVNRFEVLLGGKVVVATTDNTILIGRRIKVHKTALEDFEYVWREIKIAKQITTMSAYVRDANISGKAKQSPKDHRVNLDIAIGDVEGTIHLFEDILTSFTAMERLQKDSDRANVDVNTDALRSKHLHWHREAVCALKWSRDAGNYLISGGRETVLVIWQLSTGKQQHLPHLTAAIENITVSPLGASYAIALANNSVIVLSTAELQAKTNIVGIQSRRVDPSKMPEESGSVESAFENLVSVPMAVDPKNGYHVLFPVPSSQPRSPQAPEVSPEPYLQTFDISAGRSAFRQALTRNNATDPNMAPDGSKIHEPTVKLLQISNDGKWLATVDEWFPPRKDLSYLDEGIAEFNEEEQSFRREIYLKFWQWDEKTSQWSLISRIDSPHFFEDVGASARVLSLIADPSGVGFATVGEDRNVRVWRPKTRTRTGTIVRGAEEGLVNWSLDHSVELENSIDSLESASTYQSSQVPVSARLAFSADGSVLAAGISWISEDGSGSIHLIDSNSGTIQQSISEIDVGILACLGIVGRYLVALGDSIIVWDLVVDQLLHCIPLVVPGADDILDAMSLIRLAINEADGTFAIAYPSFDQRELVKTNSGRRYRKASSKISIFSPEQPRPLWSSRTTDVVLALEAARDGKGYVVLDSSSSIRTVRPMGENLQLQTPPPESTSSSEQAAAEQLSEDDMNDDEQVSTERAQRPLLSQDAIDIATENDKPVVRPEQLQRIFDTGPSHALPPVKDLLSAVVDLYARKPRVAGSV